MDEYRFSKFFYKVYKPTFEDPRVGHLPSRITVVRVLFQSVLSFYYVPGPVSLLWNKCISLRSRKCSVSWWWVTWPQRALLSAFHTEKCVHHTPGPEAVTHTEGRPERAAGTQSHILGLPAPVCPGAWKKWQLKRGSSVGCVLPWECSGAPESQDTAGHTQSSQVTEYAYKLGWVLKRVVRQVREVQKGQFRPMSQLWIHVGRQSQRRRGGSWAWAGLWMMARMWGTGERQGRCPTAISQADMHGAAGLCSALLRTLRNWGTWIQIW